MKVFFILFVALILTGCATNDKAYNLYISGQYQAAADEAGKTSARDTYACYLHAKAYYDNLGRQKEGLSLMNFCAQQGGNEARQWLALNNFPIPDTIRPSDRAVDVNIHSK